MKDFGALRINEISSPNSSIPKFQGSIRREGRKTVRVKASELPKEIASSRHSRNDIFELIDTVAPHTSLYRFKLDEVSPLQHTLRRIRGHRLPALSKKLFANGNQSQFSPME